jgi:hypothetical protein
VDYYLTSLSRLEAMRSRIKYADPGTIDLNDIRDTLGFIIADLEVLAALRHPESFKLTRRDDGLDEIVITMVLPQSESDDLLRKLWLDDSV